MRVHFDFGEDVPDLLLDNLMKGFAPDVSWWPARQHVNSVAPTLGTPMIQCWGTPALGAAVETRGWLSQADQDDVLIVTHRVDKPDGERLLTLSRRVLKLVAIDAYDKPCFAWRDAAKAAGFKVFAREVPRDGEIAIDYAFNPLWTPPPRLMRDRLIGLLFVGDMHVGLRQVHAQALVDHSRCSVIGGDYTGGPLRLSFAEWQTALSCAQVVVVPHGAGEATYRLWEAAAAGCALLVERFVTRPAPEGLVEGETCLFFDGTADPDAVGGIRAVAQRLLYEPGLSTRLGMAAREEAWVRHTPEAQAQRVLREIAR